MTESMTHVADECLELETIAAYLDGRLSEREREAVTAHLASCETCYFIFVEAAQTRPAVAEVVTSPKWWRRPAVIGPAAVALATAATLVMASSFSLLPWQRSEEPALQALVAAVGTDRTFVPRLTGGFEHGPVRGAVRSGNAGAPTLTPDVRIAAAQIEKETGTQPSPQGLHARGIAALIVGDLDRAVVALEASATGGAANAPTLNDLASAYLVRGEQTNNKDDLSKALATLNRALELDRTSPEVLFNRAYALERLGLTSEAHEAWQAYLTIDNRSGWADEARARLRALGAQT